MLVTDAPRVGYVLKRYPRYSETFIVNEILAHEAAGVDIEIFSLYPPNDDHFQDAISHVRAPVTYLTAYGLKAADLWSALGETSALIPGIWDALEVARGEDVRNVYQALLLARAVKARCISHLHAHFGNVATTVARLASHFTGIPYTFTAHAKDIFHESVQFADLERKLTDARGVITVSNYNLDYLHETFGPAAARVRRVYNGLDLDNFQFAAPYNRPPVIVAVGRLVEKKGFADLIDACAILADHDTDFICRIIGTGELESALQAQIERLGLRGRVELLGPRPQYELTRHVGCAALFAAPCVVGSDGNRDGLPTVLLEAMALGTPCVSTDVTGIPEVVHEGETGLIVPQHDPASLASAIERLLRDADLRVRLATQARTLIEEEFSVHRNAARLRDIFSAASELSFQATGGARA
ncbi:MAG TPA: glycosyltransferase family 4 protein [Chloroflexia bacterium]|nr:glycosyltransferase family 4 protein [Chloroflexia bacterium]